MVQKTFSIYEKNGIVKMQVGGDLFGLDNCERKNIFNCLSDVKESRFLFPNKTYGVAIMYENGLVAANISVGKIDIAGTKYIMMVYSLKPNSSQYEVNSFMLTGEAIAQYMDILAAN